jgi:carbon-monoxide dehydrogenase small subunit
MVMITLNVNDNEYSVEVAPYRTLLETLRDKLGLTEVKNSCGEGECGSCTVLLDGKPVVSCLMPAVQADGRRITTITGLSGNGKLHPIQRKFIEHDAVQCGYCTPGMVLSAKALLDNNPNPTEEEAKIAISGNICRCTGYQQIVEAIMAAADES